MKKSLFECDICHRASNIAYRTKIEVTKVILVNGDKEQASLSPVTICAEVCNKSDFGALIDQVCEKVFDKEEHEKANLNYKDGEDLVLSSSEAA